MKLVRVFALSLACVAALFPLTLLAQAHGGGRGMATVMIGDGKVTVDYGRPELKGRNVNELMVVGKIWRMGKDDATTLTSDVDLVFGEKKLAKGKYTLVAKKIAADQWNLLILSKGDFYRFDPAGVTLEVPMQVTEAKPSVELETIELAVTGNTATLTVMWGSLKASVSFKKA
ncbi:MAG: DUF2911 domain-containing protein [Acidobacteria bacterium]|nr:DUF2911 domain-containing protein [Acidobacteriota bacterium]MBI3655666.1 DUF2911 domain-containing protein [Acidobacteriota bacterium]